MKYYNNLGWATDVLSQSARTYLIDYFEEYKKYREQTYNLFKTWQKHMDYEDPMQVEMVSRIQKATETAMRMKLLPATNGKLVEYVEGSSARGHVDAKAQSSMSVITMINLSQDLRGGEAYFAKDVTAMEYHKMIPGPLENGDSLMYGGSMFHGVEQIFSGKRLVLITWFMEDHSDREVNEKIN